MLQHQEVSVCLLYTSSIGHYCGFELYLTRDPLQYCILWGRGETKRQVDAGMTPQGMMQRLGNALSGIEEHIPDCEKRISLLKEQLKTAKAELDKPLSLIHIWK